MESPVVRKTKRAVENRKTEEIGCEVICGAPTTPAVKGGVKVMPSLRMEIFARFLRFQANLRLRLGSPLITTFFFLALYFILLDIQIP